MKPSSYRVEHSGDQSAVYRLDVVAAFLEKGLADEFAVLKNGPAPGGVYAVEPDGNEFCVTQAHQLANFFYPNLADEYVEMKVNRGIRQPQVIGGRPDGTAAPQLVRVEEPVNFDEIWAKAASGDVSR
jgi:hypothetical protein